MPRPGTKQVIRTTVRGPSTITRERRDEYRERLQGYMKSRTDLKANTPQAATSPAPVPAYQAPAGGMGQNSAVRRAQRNAQARAHRAAIKQRKLGSPLHAQAAPSTPAATSAYNPEDPSSAAYDPDEFNASKISQSMVGQPKAAAAQAQQKHMAGIDAELENERSALARNQARIRARRAIGRLGSPGHHNPMTEAAP